jgi:fido (protein-threonine AMPylation protein)
LISLETDAAAKRTEELTIRLFRIANYDDLLTIHRHLFQDISHGTEKKEMLKSAKEK